MTERFVVFLGWVLEEHACVVVSVNWSQRIFLIVKVAVLVQIAFIKAFVRH